MLANIRITVINSRQKAPLTELQLRCKDVGRRKTKTKNNNK